MTQLNWRWLLGLSSIPSFSLLFFYGLAPESPRYLCAKGRTEDAQKILQNIAILNHQKLPSGVLVSHTTTSGEFSSSENTVESSPTKKVISKLKSVFSSFLVLFSPKLIRTTILLWVLFFASGFLYYGIVLLTSKLSKGGNNCGSSVQNEEKLQGDDSLYTEVFITNLAGAVVFLSSPLFYHCGLIFGFDSLSDASIFIFCRASWSSFICHNCRQGWPKDLNGSYVWLRYYIPSAIGYSSVYRLDNSLAVWCSNVYYRNHHSRQYLCP